VEVVVVCAVVGGLDWNGNYVLLLYFGNGRNGSLG